MRELGLHVWQLPRRRALLVIAGFGLQVAHQVGHVEKAASDSILDERWGMRDVMHPCDAPQYDILFESKSGNHLTAPPDPYVSRKAKLCDRALAHLGNLVEVSGLLPLPDQKREFDFANLAVYRGAV